MMYTTAIQWKGTDLCMDFNCPGCGEHSHFDGMFIYTIKCASCGNVYRLAEEIALTEIKPGDEGYDTAAVDIDESETSS